MSAQDPAPHDHGADEHEHASEHDAHTAHAEPALPEPESPAWLPLLGGGLFLLGLLGYLVTRTPDPEDEAAKAAAAASASAAAVPAPAPRPIGSTAERPRRIPPLVRPDRLRDALDVNGARPLPRPLPSR
jgi:hypothetical protein